jgi:murein DD-endopeptidase MepM/ murein hydrolase activator NlpD
LVGGGAAAGAAVALYLVLQRRRVASPARTLPMPSSPSPVRGAPSPVLLGVPLAGVSLPFRHSPNGYYHAPRYLLDSGTSTAYPPYSGAPVHHYHEGVDLVARVGADILAVGDGAIVAVQPGLGKAVLKLELASPGTWESGTITGSLVSHVVYADLGPRLVQPGDRVRAGQPIARVHGRGFVHFAVKRLRSNGDEEFFDPVLAGFPYAQKLVA